VLYTTPHAILHTYYVVNSLMAIAYILSFCEVIQPVVSRLQILLSQPSIGAECIDLCVIVAAAHMPLRCRKSLPSR